MKHVLFILLTAFSVITLCSCSKSDMDGSSVQSDDESDSAKVNVITGSNTLPETEPKPQTKAKEDVPQVFTGDFNGIVLTITTDKSEYHLDDAINVTASVKNTTEKRIHLLVSTSSPNSHREIKTEIFRDKMYLIDTDTDKALFFDDTAVLSIEPDEEYVQDMKFETYFYESDYGKKAAESGLYTGNSTIRVLTDPDGWKTIRYSTEFSLTLK